jgi:hypothetical protein
MSPVCGELLFLQLVAESLFDGDATTFEHWQGREPNSDRDTVQDLRRSENTGKSFLPVE